MNKLILWLIPFAILALVTFFYFHNRGEGEEQSEAKISTPSKLTVQNHAPPELDLSPENVRAADIQSIPLAQNAFLEPFHLHSDAIVWTLNRTWVYLRLSETQFTRAEIIADTNSINGTWRFKTRLSDGATRLQLVTRGAQILLSDEMKSEIQLGD